MPTATNRKGESACPRCGEPVLAETVGGARVVVNAELLAMVTYARPVAVIQARTIHDTVTCDRRKLQAEKAAWLAARSTT